MKEALATDAPTLATLGAGLTKTGYAAAPVAVFGGLAANELAAFGGLAVAVVGLFVGQGINWYYKHKENKRAEMEHLERMQGLEESRLFVGERRTSGADRRAGGHDRRAGNDRRTGRDGGGSL